MRQSSAHEIERRRRVRQLWQERYTEDQRTGFNVLGFHRWLEQNRPELLHQGHGDLAYQHLKATLTAFGEIKNHNLEASEGVTAHSLRLCLLLADPKP